LPQKITTLFLDVGGVLLANGWDLSKRKKAAEIFGLDIEELNERHHLTFGTYEEGKLELNRYLDRVVFYMKRSFSRDEFKSFMFQSRSYIEMIDLIRDLKNKYGLKTVVVSNEGKELTVHRIKEFGLASFIDFFVVSCFVHFRKPDEDIYRMALNIAQAPVENVVYIDDRAMFVEVGRNLGIQSIHHVTYESTRNQLESAGLVL
jgi:putative hydrolase of the HAD superfamily